MNLVLQFWGPMAKGSRAKDKRRRPRVEEHKHPFKMALSNFNTRIFSTLKHLSFLKTKPVWCSIKVRSNCDFLKPFLVHVVKIMESAT